MNSYKNIFFKIKKYSKINLILVNIHINQKTSSKWLIIFLNLLYNKVNNNNNNNNIDQNNLLFTSNLKIIIMKAHYFILIMKDLKT